MKEEMIQKIMRESISRGISDLNEELQAKKIYDLTSISSYSRFLFFESKDSTSRLSQLGTENIAHISTFCGRYGVTNEKESREVVNSMLNKI